MKTAIFNFLVLQAVVWAFIFSADNGQSADEINYASISDTWEVVKVAEPNTQNVVLHYPTFNKLTLNMDGTYRRLIDDETIEIGNWTMDANETSLILKGQNGQTEYEIIQMPYSSSESFIIKENNSGMDSMLDIQYQLNRM